MCTEVVQLPSGVLGKCRECKECRSETQRSLRGRGIAERQLVREAWFVTLTYGSDSFIQGKDLAAGQVLEDQRSRTEKEKGKAVNFEAHARFIHQSDIIAFMKRIRKACEPERVSYLCAAEYGPLNGRVHWHAIIFFYGEKRPQNVELTPVGSPPVRFHWWSEKPGAAKRRRGGFKKGRAFWTWGFAQVSQANTNDIAYVVKYMSKDMGRSGPDLEDSRPSYSRRPGLGFEYFGQLARRYVEQGLPPRLDYSFPGEYAGNGQPWVYWMSRKNAEFFLATYVAHWQETYGNMNWPYSELVDAYLDRVTVREENERLSEVILEHEDDFDFGERESRRLLERQQLRRERSRSIYRPGEVAPALAIDRQELEVLLAARRAASERVADLVRAEESVINSARWLIAKGR